MTATKQVDKAAPFTLVVDTREKKPYSFAGFDVIVKGLKTGDYSIVGLEDKLAVERKSFSDAWQSMSSSRERFTRCIKRLAELDRAAIVIECSLTELSIPPRQVQRVSPASVVGGLISWSAQYAIPVFFCDNPMLAERVTLRFLAAYFTHRSGLYMKGR